MNVPSEPLYHVTALSNFARAFDKYTRQYRKGSIPRSTYPNESYLLPVQELSIGIAKARRLVSKLAIPGDEPLVMQAAVSHSQVRPNSRHGLGLVWPSPDLPISGTFATDSREGLGPALSLEDAMARSLDLHAPQFTSYSDLRPRSVSLLPIARGCQAACPFCFSEASASVDQRPARFEIGRVQRWIEFARSRGAERAVITGGGEPTLLPWGQLLALVNGCRNSFDKTVLITNGVRLASASRSEITMRLHELSDAGLSVLAVSRHHNSEAVNENLMKLQTMTPTLLEAYAGLAHSSTTMRLRLICVLQRGGVESTTDIQKYVAWATSFGVEEVCFKELYVSTSRESVYFSHSANTWSTKNQVPLSLVHEWAEENGLNVCGRLPWGVPIFAGIVGGRHVRVAAYTEPSLFWERSHGLARSWNVMSNGECLASLEDRRSVVALSGTGSLQ